MNAVIVAMTVEALTKMDGSELHLFCWLRLKTFSGRVSRLECHRCTDVKLIKNFWRMKQIKMWKFSIVCPPFHGL